MPTLNDILHRGGSLILVSHLGRPTGDPAADAPFRMDKVAERLEQLIGRPVKKTADTVGPEAQAAAEALAPGGIVLLENVRFNKGEKKGDPAFAKQMAALADAYVNDAFGTCHRDEASMVAVPEQFPANHRPLASWSRRNSRSSTPCSANPKSPYVAVMGGAKVSDKILVIENLLRQVDKLLVGGAMTYTFLKAQGHSVGQSKVEADKLDVARHVLDLAGSKLVLPVDHLVATKPEAGAETKVVEGPNIPDGWFGMDIGPKTIDLYSGIIRQPGPSSGTGRWASSRSRPSPRAPGPSPRPLPTRPGDRRRRRRIGRGCREVRPGREGQPRLHRRRRIPRVARGQDLQFAQGHSRPLRRGRTSETKRRGAALAPFFHLTASGGIPTTICFISL